MAGIFGLFLAEPIEIPPGVGKMAAQLLSPNGKERVSLWRTQSCLLGVCCPALDDTQAVGSLAVNESGRIHTVCEGKVLNQAEVRHRLVRVGHVVPEAGGAGLMAHLGEGPQGDWELGLRGTFSSAVWDGIEHTLRLSVDHLGAKSLYWLGDKHWVAFASVLPALRGMMLEWGREEPALVVPSSLRRCLQDSAWRVDLQGARSFLESGYITAPRTMCQSVYSLPPAGRLIWKAGSEPSVDVWWTPRFQPQRTLSLRKAIPDFQQVFRETLPLYLEHGNRNVLFLSADPASVFLSYEASLLGGVNCLTRFLHGEGSNPQVVQMIRGTAASLPLEYQECHLPPPCQEDLPLMVQTLSEPCSNPSIWNTFAAIRQAGETCIPWLANLGSDEVWEVIPPTVSSPQRNFWNGVLAPETGLESLPLLGPEAKRSEDRAHLQELRVRCHLPFAHLRPLQTMAAVHSLDIRFPWLDPVLFEWMSRLPGNLKTSGHWSHWLLRKSLQAGPYTVPQSLLALKASPSQPPLDRWLARDLAFLFQGTVLSSGSQASPLFQTSRLRQIFEANRAGVVKLGRQLWAVLMLELWLRENRLAV